MQTVLCKKRFYMQMRHEFLIFTLVLILVADRFVNERVELQQVAVLEG